MEVFAFLPANQGKLSIATRYRVLGVSPSEYYPWRGRAPSARSKSDEVLNMAPWQRRPEVVIHHSVQGCQYTSFAFGQRCRQMGVRSSMDSVGDCFDNAMAESFFATLACVRIDRHRIEP